MGKPGVQDVRRPPAAAYFAENLTQTFALRARRNSKVLKDLADDFDRNLNFFFHLKQVKLKCLKAANTLRVLSYKSWEYDRNCL